MSNKNPDSLTTTVLLALARDHRLTLTVSSRNSVHRFELQPGEAPTSRAPFEADCQALPEGKYAWQLTATPAGAMPQAVAGGGLQDLELDSPGFTQSGTFTIAGDR